MAADNGTEKKSFSHTLNLPKTNFPIRAQASVSEPKILQFWEDSAIYEQSLQERLESKPFVLHNGPPYANGNIHIGHVLNQTLKDIVCRSRRMEGFKSFFKAGWDCHGLPIEIKVLKELGWDKNPDALDAQVLKQKCKEFAQLWIDRQMVDLKRLGLMADFKNYYSTMSPEYEAGVLEVFAKFVAQGFIGRREKTVPWCFSCQTTLASAEIEYKDRKDPSCYVLFAAEISSVAEALPELISCQVNFLPWTTTPWTLPLNRALVLKPDTEYCAVEFAAGRVFIVAEKLAAKVCAKLGLELKITLKFNSARLAHVKILHPFNPLQFVPVIFDHFVSLEDGTAVVHCAPGCGPEDYLIALRERLEVYSPLSSAGTYTDEIVPAELKGMPITEGQWWCLKFLQTNGNLLFKENITHSYPHCWRCKNGLMFRATKQWFCNLDVKQVKNRLLAELENINFVPDWGKNRLEAAIKTRAEWCISRQRHWGVPIVALKCKICDESFTSAEFVLAVSRKVQVHGISFWDEVTVEELAQLAKVPAKGCECAVSAWHKEKDIIDVWFESGASFWSVHENDAGLTPGQENLSKAPADIYLEGSDQHRAWFQTSLFCAMVATDKPCMKTILTHGYIVDEKREKMSKSLGNALDAQELLAQYGADVIRLWVASTDYKNDAPISREMLESIAGIFRKIRNTCRFMISTIHDYDGKVVESDAKKITTVSPIFMIPHQNEFTDWDEAQDFTNVNFLAVDRLMLGKLLKFTTTVRLAYAEFDFTTIFSAVANFCNNDLSAEYFDIVKDRLYVEPVASNSRRAAQATIYHILDCMTHLMAPILPFLTEELSEFYNDKKTTSIHTHQFLSKKYLEQLLNRLDEKMIVFDAGENLPTQAKLAVEEFWILVEKLRRHVLKAIEKQREQKIIKHSLEARVLLFIDPQNEFGKNLNQGLSAIDKNFEGALKFLEDFFIVSQVVLLQAADELEATELDWLKISVTTALGSKCARCWRWEESVQNELCKRCEKIVMGMQSAGI